MSNFEFLKNEPYLKELYQPFMQAEALLAESTVVSAQAIYKCADLAVRWFYSINKDEFKLPFKKDNFAALIFNTDFADRVSEEVKAGLDYINKLGGYVNIHAKAEVTKAEVALALRSLFDFALFLSYTYGTNYTALSYDETLLATPTVTKRTKEAKDKDTSLQALESEIAALCTAINEFNDETIAAIEAQRVANASSRAAKYKPLSEASTRKLYIDIDLKTMGWEFKKNCIEEYPVAGMPNDSGDGFVDYVLFGDNGKPLAVVEAKRTTKDPEIGRTQGQLYADCLERSYGQRPLIFYTNGYKTWFWDDWDYPPRKVYTVFSKYDLQWIVDYHTMRLPLGNGKLNINPEITDRHYQMEAIQAVCADFRNKRRKALLVMATGTGKTRTAASLVDVLTSYNWATNILFLADRRELVKQAKDAFKKFLPNLSSCNLSDRGNDKPSHRAVFSTYPTIMNAINEEKTDDFYIFDYLGNFEFFRETPNGIEASDTRSLSEVIFSHKIRLIKELQTMQYQTNEYIAFRNGLIDDVTKQVGSLNREHFHIKLALETVEKYSNKNNFICLGDIKTEEVIGRLAPLIYPADNDDETARRLDALTYRLELAYLSGNENDKVVISSKIKNAALQLEQKATIPQVFAKRETLSRIQQDAFWASASILDIDAVRRDLRDLMQYLKKEFKTKVINMSDTVIFSQEGERLPADTTLETYYQRAARYIAENETNSSILKLKNNENLTDMDWVELERICSIAEEESRGLSTNVKWTFAKQASQGIIMSPHAYFGYTAKGKDLVINPKNAKIVRLIYDTFEQRKRVSAVAKYMERQGILSPHGNNKWHYSTVLTILTNEAYIGDIILQKTFTNDFLSKRKKNNGERKKWYVKNHHPAIITREQFNRVQQIYADNKETNKQTKSFTKFPFSCLLVCANCGRHYMHAEYVIGEKKIPYWVCLSVKHHKEVGCTSAVIKEYILNRAYLSISPDNSLSTFRDKVEKLVIDKMLATFYFYTGEVVKLDLAKFIE